MHRRELLRLLASAFFPAPITWPLRSGAEQPGSLNVMDFGARGDGITDDSGAFEAAIAAASRTRGSQLRVPPLHYKLLAPLRIRSEMAIVGDGHGCWLDFRLGAVAAISNGDLRRVQLRGLRVSGTFAAGIAVSNSTDITISRCEISGAVADWSDYTAGIRIVGGRDIRIVNNVLFGNGNAHLHSGADVVINGNGYSSTRVTITDNRCSSIQVAMNIACFDVSDSVVSGNRVSGATSNAANNSGYGILVYDSTHRGDCRGNLVERNTVADTQGSGVYLAAVTDSAVVGNVVTRAGSVQNDATLPVGGIAINGGRHIAVRRNLVRVSGSDGIVVSNGSGHGVAENTVAAARGTGIHLRGTASAIAIVRNTVTGVPIGIGSDRGFAPSNVVIAENRITVLPEQGCAIQLPGGSELVIERNVIGSTLKRCICVDGTASVIDGNSPVP